jgi:hypothetical protein
MERMNAQSGSLNVQGQFLSFKVGNCQHEKMERNDTETHAINRAYANQKASYIQPLSLARAPASDTDQAKFQYVQTNFPANPDRSQDRVDEKCLLLSLPFQFNFPSEVNLEVRLRCERVYIIGNLDIACKTMLVPNSSSALHLFRV